MNYTLLLTDEETTIFLCRNYNFPESFVKDIWLFLLLDIILLIVSLTVLLLVTVKYKRKEFFLIVIPAINLTYAISNTIDVTLKLNSILCERIAYVDDFIANFFYLLCHFLFSSQYLMTCLIFPKLFAEATLTNLEKNA